MMMSDVEMPSVLCVGTNIPVQIGKRRSVERTNMADAFPFMALLSWTKVQLPGVSAFPIWPQLPLPAHFCTLPPYHKHYMVVTLDLLPGGSMHSPGPQQLVMPSPSGRPWIPCPPHIHCTVPPPPAAPAVSRLCLREVFPDITRQNPQHLG